MPVRVAVPPCEAFTFIHSIRHPLREREAWSHDLNVTVATEVAQRASKTDFQLEPTAK